MIVKKDFDNKKLYEQPEHWGILTQNEEFMKKARLIKALIPQDVKTILDVGCGDGSLTNYLIDEQYSLMAFDRSQIALSHVKTKRILGNICTISFKDNSFDMVICSQVLEHLPNDTLQKAVSELSRIASKYLIISVPYHEQLRERFTKCSQCGLVYHTWGHVRSFRSVRHLTRLFSLFTLQTYVFCSKMSYQNPILLYIKQTLGNEWAWEKSSLCPQCGNACNSNNAKINRTIKYLTDGIQWRIGKKEEFWWLVCLFEKKRGNAL